MRKIEVKNLPLVFGHDKQKALKQLKEGRKKSKI